MPLRDKTFSDADLVRLFCNHLTKEERTNVVVFFILYSGALVLKSSILDLLAAVPQIRGIRTLINLLLAAVRIFTRTDHTVLSNVFSGKMLAAVIACLTKEIGRK